MKMSMVLTLDHFHFSLQPLPFSSHDLNIIRRQAVRFCPKLLSYALPLSGFAWSLFHEMTCWASFSWQFHNPNNISMLFLVSNGYLDWKCEEIKFQFWAHVQINFLYTEHKLKLMYIFTNNCWKAKFGQIALYIIYFNRINIKLP